MSTVDLRIDQLRTRVEEIRGDLRGRVQALQERVRLLSDSVLPTRNFPILDQVRARGVIAAVRERAPPRILALTRASPQPRYSPETAGMVSRSIASKEASPQTAIKTQTAEKASPQREYSPSIVDRKGMAVEAEPAYPVDKREMSVIM